MCRLSVTLRQELKKKTKQWHPPSAKTERERATVSIANPQTLLRLTSTAIFNSIRGIGINSHRWELMNSFGNAKIISNGSSVINLGSLCKKIKISSVYWWMRFPSPYILDTVMTKT